MPISCHEEGRGNTAPRSVFSMMARSMDRSGDPENGCGSSRRTRSLVRGLFSYVSLHRSRMAGFRMRSSSR
ncbi:MAG: hypothetical protein OXF02_01995 [Simkaniaceae bacterium]|nr:hypothetical protein [Simkaniaceae bacterium]